MRKIASMLVFVAAACLAGCGPSIRKDMPEAEARAALTSFLSSQGHGCTDEAILNLRGALASYSVHMDAAQRTWPHPQGYRLAPRVNGEKVKLRALDDTDLLALLAVRDGLAQVSDFAPLAQQMIELTWTYHTPDVHRQRFGDYSEGVRTASCQAFVDLARSRFLFDRAMIQRELTGRAESSMIYNRAQKVNASECELNRALIAAGGKAEACES
jgi:hypothetical protein